MLPFDVVTRTGRVTMTKSFLLRCFSLVFVSVPLCMGATSAQDKRSRDVESMRHVFGISGTLARPVGEFQNFVSWGGGGSLYGVFNIAKNSPLGVRLEASLLSYGHERMRVPLSLTVQRVWVDVNTDNLIMSGGVGPQLTIGNGPVRPYVYGTVGFAYFATVSSVEGTSNDEAFASTTNYDDVGAALNGGAGLMIQLSHRKHAAALDMSFQTHRNGNMSYLRSGSILEEPDGSISFTPIYSEANLVTFRIGFAFKV